MSENEEPKAEEPNETKEIDQIMELVDQYRPPEPTEAVKKLVESFSALTVDEAKQLIGGLQDLPQLREQQQKQARERMEARRKRREEGEFIASDESREAFANAVLNGERERLREQPSKSSSHRLALQQALGLSAEIVFHFREFLEIWGRPCSPRDFKIWLSLERPDGTLVTHGIGLTQLVASVAPCGEKFSEPLQKTVKNAFRNIAWTLACISKDVAQMHADMEAEMMKEIPENPSEDLPPDEGVSC